MRGRNTQINGETYVNVNDVAAWLETNGDDVREHSSISADCLDELARVLRQWGSNPARKRGVPNNTMAVQ
jgi:hypothetical protein